MAIRLVERTPTSLSLSWDVSPQPRAQNRAVRYEITYRKNVSCFFVIIFEVCLNGIFHLLQLCFIDDTDVTNGPESYGFSYLTLMI